MPQVDISLFIYRLKFLDFFLFKLTSLNIGAYKSVYYYYYTIANTVVCNYKLLWTRDKSFLLVTKPPLNLLLIELTKLAFIYLFMQLVSRHNVNRTKIVQKNRRRK